MSRSVVVATLRKDEEFFLQGFAHVSFQRLFGRGSRYRVRVRKVSPDTKVIFGKRAKQAIPLDVPVASG